MKYIITKNGMIINLINKEYDINARGDIVLEDNLYIPYDEILKVGDTIEELCDEYVVEDDYYSAIFNNLKLARQTKGTCYGAIRTEWGLKYVAKMNEKGEMELL